MQVCTSLQTDNHASTPPLSFLQVECPSCRPTNSVKALKATNLLEADRPNDQHVRGTHRSCKAANPVKLRVDLVLADGKVTVDLSSHRQR